jgi:prepilin-type N-terminal cleavage/methylation domain-containing protein
MVRRHCRSSPGFTILELLFAVAIAGTLAAIALPQSLRALDDFRTRSAAHYLARRLATARFLAIRRSTAHGLRFEIDDEDYKVSLVADGNGNGIKTTELQSGSDRTLSEREGLSGHFAGVRFGILDGVPDADGNPSGGSDGVRFGSTKVVVMNADGTASSGTLYVNGAGRSQYAVRVLGSTGRVRLLKFDAVRRRWVDLT